MAEISNHLKAVLVLNDLSADYMRVNKSDCITLKRFHYRCSRGHDSFHVTGSLTGASILSMELKLNTEAKVSTFYEYMHKNVPQPFSIMFNVTFDSDSTVSSCLDSMTVFGYVVAVTDVFNAGVMRGEGRGTIDLKVDVLLSTIVYEGKNQNLVLPINSTSGDR